MKKIKTVWVMVMLCVTMGVIAGEGDEINPRSGLCAQIHQLLKENAFDLERGDITAEVHFTINKNGELVVLSVETQNQRLENFVKSRLNYQRVQIGTISHGKLYKLPIRITA